MKLKLLTAIALLPLVTTPALADVPMPTPIELQQRGGSGQMSSAERDAYRAIFSDIRDRNWVRAQERLSNAPRSILNPIARAELYMAAGSPRVEMDQLRGLLNDAPDLHNAQQIARLAQRRGLERLPAMPNAQTLRRVSGPSRRGQARPIRDSATRSLVRQIRPLIVADNPRGAEDILNQRQGNLSTEGRTEAQQRVAWSYYLTGDDRSAQRIARLARNGSGEWAAQADWVDGLASWRRQDCNSAANAFAAFSRRASNSEMRAAGLYWAARAEMVCQRPENVQAHLRAASVMNETFYGLLALQTLGIAPPAPAAETSTASIQSIAGDANARRAVALHQIGERSLAEAYVQHGASLSNSRNHDSWIALAQALNLPNAQLWLSRRAPTSHHPTARTRFPAPAYQPRNGWRVDQSLVYAHALQESNFQPEVVSPAGARGLLQLMPGTARDLARDHGETISASRLNIPEINIDFGQRYMEQMRDFPTNGGLLTNIIASYNAGPGAVRNWTNGRLRDGGDPLLYIESIPFYETRGYVPIILRNYWMYQRNAGSETTSLAAMAQGMWARFPGASGPNAVRLTRHDVGSNELTLAD